MQLTYIVTLSKECLFLPRINGLSLSAVAMAIYRSAIDGSQKKDV